MFNHISPQLGANQLQSQSSKPPCQCRSDRTEGQFSDHFKDSMSQIEGGEKLQKLYQESASFVYVRIEIQVAVTKDVIPEEEGADALDMLKKLKNEIEAMGGTAPEGFGNVYQGFGEMIDILFELLDKIRTEAGTFGGKEAQTSVTSFSFEAFMYQSSLSRELVSEDLSPNAESVKDDAVIGAEFDGSTPVISESTLPLAPVAPANLETFVPGLEGPSFQDIVASTQAS
ncbi:MAG: hypothetical protein ACI9BD_000667 [Candidatus Marinamargulisbacteria bacterium]|jgi:hypothetical protein